MEIPKGSQNKYEYDEELKAIKLQRVLFSPIHYPGDYGIIPRTITPDGDPLDALVLVTYPTYPGTIIESKPIGVLKMLDSGKKDDKILCVPLHDVRFSDISDIKNIQKSILNEISHFFAVYKQLEGKKVVICGWENSKVAKSVIVKALQAYKKHH